MESKCSGLSIQPSTDTPPLTGTLKYSTGGLSIGATVRLRSVLAASTRAVWCDGMRTRSVTGGTSKAE